MVDWIGETFCSDTGWTHLERLVDIGSRMAGTDGERRGAEVTREAFDDVGAQKAHLDTFPIQGWERVESTLRPQGESDDLDCIALPRSPDRSVSGQLIDLGYGVAEDFAEQDVEGKIVMVASNAPPAYDRFPHRREKYYYAVRDGAIGFVFRNHVEGCLPPTGSIGRDGAPIGEIPAVGVSKETGLRLARRHDGAEVELTVEADIYDGTSQNVHAYLGPGTGDRVLITSHVDGHDISEGAGDNAAGTAMLVEVAKALSHREAELDTRVEFIAYGAEEVGLCGSRYHDSVTEEAHVKVIVNCDGVVGGRTLQAFTHRFEELEAALDRVSRRFDHPIRTLPKEGFRGDQWPLVRWGVPGYFVSGYRDTEGRGYGHTQADTLDKLESRNLREQAVLLTELVIDLASESVSIPHRTPSEVARSFSEEGKVEGMKIVGDWPYEFDEPPDPA